MRRAAGGVNRFVIPPGLGKIRFFNCGETTGKSRVSKRQNCERATAAGNELVELLRDRGARSPRVLLPLYFMAEVAGSAGRFRARALFALAHR